MNKNIIINNRYSYIKNINQRLGKGSFGEVYCGLDTQTNQQVAIKILNKTLFDEDAYMKTALQKELEIQKLCECQYSTLLIDHFTEGNHIYIIMELCDRDLNEDLKINGPFDTERIRTILIQLNHVFAIMYSKKIIHRDLKLGNILIKYTNKDQTQFDVKLSDFGFSTVAENNCAFTGVGTPVTSAPEILKELPYTNKVDLWSLGIIIYQMHFGKVPFFSMNHRTFLMIITNKKPPKTAEDPLLADLISKLIEPNVDKRISWEEYFQHPFFGNRKINFSTLPHSNGQSYMSVMNATNELDKKNMSIQLQEIKYKFVFMQKYQNFSTENFFCSTVKDENSGKMFILKRYRRKFVEQHKEEFEEEKKMFKLFENENISTLKYVGDYETGNECSLIFEYMKGVVVKDFIRQRQLNEYELYLIIHTCIKRIFEPMIKLGKSLSIITLDSIAINYELKCATLVDCGFIRNLYSKEDIQEYFIYPNEINVQNEQTNVLNLGVTIFKAFFQMNPSTSSSSNSISLPYGIEYSNEFKEFIASTLTRRPEKRPTFETLANSTYIQSPFSFSSKNKSLFSMRMLEHIEVSFSKKIEVIQNFINSETYLNLPKQYISQTLLFMLSIKADLFFAYQCFEEFLSNKEKLSSLIHVVSIFPDEIEKLNRESRYLDLRVIPIDKRYCIEDVLKKMRDLIPKLKEMEKKIMQMFKKESQKSEKPYFGYNKDQITNSFINQLRDQKLKDYVNEITNSVGKRKGMKNVGLYLKYLLEFAITLYEINFGETKVLMNIFYEINEMYEETAKIEISEWNKIGEEKEVIWKGMVFSSFIKHLFDDFKKNCSEKDLIKMKEELESINEMFISYYIDVMREINDNELDD